MDKLARLRVVIDSLPGGTHKKRLEACAALSGRRVSTIESWLSKPPAPDVPDSIIRLLILETDMKMYNVLRSPIPFNGRRLKTAECNLLRKFDVKCSVHDRVCRIDPRFDHFGKFLKRKQGSGHVSTDIALFIVPDA